MKAIFFVRHGIIFSVCCLLLIGGCDNSLIPESARKELSNKTTVQTDWSNEEERINTHKKKVAENRNSSSTSKATYKESSPRLPEKKNISLKKKSKIVKSVKDNRLRVEKSKNTKVKKIKNTKSGKARPGSGSYSIQLGAFSKLENAERLIKKLKERNFRVTNKVSKSGLHIVRIGPFNNKEETEKQAREASSYTNLKVVIFANNKLKAVISPRIAPKKKADKAKKATTIPAKKELPTVSPHKNPLLVEKQAPGIVNKSPILKTNNSKKLHLLVDRQIRPSAVMKYSFKIGGLYSLQNAQKQLRILKEKGYNIYIVKVKAAGDETWHSLRVGYFANIAEAANAANIFTKKEGIPAQVVK